MLKLFLTHAFYFIAKIFCLTYRFRYFGIENLEKALKHSKNGSYCLATWHEHTIATILSQSGVSYIALVSQSKDGDFVSFILEKLGHKTARGSSSRGGKEARESVKKYLKKGFPAAFTVDGPRGPRHKSKAGIIKTASETATAILPVATIADRSWILSKTWDQTKLPKPFSKICCQFGPVLTLTQNIESHEVINSQNHLNNTLMHTQDLATKNLKLWHLGKKSPASLISHNLQLTQDSDFLG